MTMKNFLRLFHFIEKIYLIKIKSKLYLFLMKIIRCKTYQLLIVPTNLFDSTLIRKTIVFSVVQISVSD
jgi:hypothetical protein